MFWRAKFKQVLKVILQNKKMSDIIHLLPDSVANQIAAGEVIQRPASVIKELVENAIDAGADSIKIVTKDAGTTLIQIIDNGTGMSETDARMAFERHATSKIKNADDLFALHTFGFRGEALASIAAIAQVEVRTRRAEDELGTLIEIAGTQISKQENVMCDKGTMISVRSLFFNVPARRRFLKSQRAENTHILNEFYRIVLVNPEVEFIYIQDNTEIFHLPQSNIKVRIDNVFGKTQKKRLQQELLTISVNTNLVDIQGFVGRPEFAQKNSNQYFFVNGRYMRHPYFHKAVMNAYGTMLKPNENPSYFIYFETGADSIDINIHPTKTEIKFENEQAIWSILSATVKESLGKFNITPSIDFDTEGIPQIPPSNFSNAEIRQPQISSNPDYNPFKSNTYKSQKTNYDWEKLYSDFETPNTPSQSDKAANFIEEIAHQNTITEFEETPKADTQFKNKYIISSLKSGMMIIDQHRAHVRILYENFLAEMESRKAPSQQVLFPEIFTFDLADLFYFEQIHNELRYVGFEFCKISDTEYEITGVPSLPENESVLPVLQELIHCAKNTEENTATAVNQMVAASLAESVAIRTGRSLTLEEMNDIIVKLFACEQSNFTPNGKAIITTISMEEIENRFK